MHFSYFDRPPNYIHRVKILGDRLVCADGVTCVRSQVTQVVRLTMRGNHLISRWKPKHLLSGLSQIGRELQSATFWKLESVLMCFDVSAILSFSEGNLNVSNTSEPFNECCENL